MLSLYILHETRTTVQCEIGYSKFCKLRYLVGPQEWAAAQQPIHQSVSDLVDNIVPLPHKNMLFFCVGELIHG
jgi:hypothetical protein